MKRFISVLLVIIVALGFMLSSCKKEEKEEAVYSYGVITVTGSATEYADSICGFSEGLYYSFEDNVGYKSEYRSIYDETLYIEDSVINSMFGITVSVETASESDANAVKIAEYGGKTLVPVSYLSALLGYDAYEYDEGRTVLFALEGKTIDEEQETDMMERIENYKNIVCDLSDVECDQTGVGKYKKTKASKRLVGIAYTTWMRNTFPSWGSGSWDIPLLGKYTSDDRDIIYQHGIMLRDAGVDFVFVDWSNNTCYDPETMRSSRDDFRMIEEATDLLFEIWSEIPGAPKICIMAGPGHSGQENVDNGNHQKKVDQIYNDYVNGQYKDMYFYYEGKPLLMCYGATPNQYGEDPEWDDERFTVRWITGYVGQQGNLFDKKTLRSYRFWSWEERGAQTYTVTDGYVECITCTAASRAQGTEGSSGYIPAYGRENGLTLKKQFQRACDLGAKMVIVVSWNEWTTGEQLSKEISKDLEPSECFGTFYYDLLTMQIKKFKGK